MNILRSLAFVFLALAFPVLGYPAGFANFYGGPSKDSPDERADNILSQTSDGGYIVIGTTESFGVGGEDMWVVKLLSNGEIEWQKSYGGSLDDQAKSIQQTPDGGYLAVGNTNSYGVGCGGTCGGIWILKLNSSGGIQWQKAYGWSGGWTGQPFSFQQSEDGGYVVLGMTNQFDEEHGDFVVLKLNSSGEMTWAKTYGGDNGEEARSIQRTKDGGYIVAGATTSFVTHENEKNCSGGSPGNAWILKLSSTGVIEWQKAYGGSGCDTAHTIRETSDGGYIVAGDTDLDGTTTEMNAWVFKLTSNGNVDWSKTYGDFGFPAWSIEQTSDGGYIVGGPLIMKLDPSGQVEWQKIYGGSFKNFTMSVKIIEGGYVVLGYTELFGAGNGDFWIFTLDTNGNKACCNLGCSAQNMGVKPGPISSVISVAEINAPEFTITNTSAVGKVSSAIINTQCPNSSVDNVVIQNTALVSNAICECSGASSITIGTGVTIESGVNITFKAPTVKIQSGFHAEEGAVVNIKQQ